MIRLQVRVHDEGIALTLDLRLEAVRMDQESCDRQGNLRCTLARKRALRDQSGELLAVYELHGDGVERHHRLVLEYRGHDMRMGITEALLEHGAMTFGGDLLVAVLPVQRDQLEGDVAFISEVARLVDDAEMTRCDQVADRVVMQRPVERAGT